MINKKIILHPNPTSGIVKMDHVEFPATKTILNINGQRVKQLIQSENEVNITDLPAGMYIFDIRNKKISEQHIIVKVE